MSQYPSERGGCVKVGVTKTSWQEVGRNLPAQQPELFDISRVLHPVDRSTALEDRPGDRLDICLGHWSSHQRNESLEGLLSLHRRHPGISAPGLLGVKAHVVLLDRMAERS